MRLSWPLLVRRVHGHSMLPVLIPGTYVIGLRWFRGVRPRRVIIFSRNGRELIKRVDHSNENGLFVLGDHPEASTDSRSYGYINREDVAAVIVWPRIVQASPDR